MNSPVSKSATTFTPGRTAMTPFVKIERNVMVGMVERGALLAQPSELYRPFFGGRTPTLAEKVQFVEGAVQRMASMHIYENNLYHVEIHYSRPFIRLSIHRHDQAPCKDWRHFQQIKNELVGPEYEAVEIFPAESRLIDTSNEYHLWVHVDPRYRFPLGFPNRFTLEEPIIAQHTIETPLATAAKETGLHTDRVAHTQPAALSASGSI